MMYLNLPSVVVVDAVVVVVEAVEVVEVVRGHTLSANSATLTIGTQVSQYPMSRSSSFVIHICKK